nr:DUF4192 domain-containing protein [Streptomyces sp. SID11385]
MPDTTEDCPSSQEQPSTTKEPRSPASAAESAPSGPPPGHSAAAQEPDVVVPAQRRGEHSPASPPENPRVPAQRRSPEHDPSVPWDEPLPFTASHAGPSAFVPEAESCKKALPERNAISLKSLADLTDSLPYLLGYVPGNSVVLLALHGERGRLGRRTAVRIPDDPAQWPQIAERAATMLLDSPGDGPGRGVTTFLRKRRGGSLPDGVIAFLFQEPEEARPGAVPPPGATEVRERLRPLAQHIRVACGRFDVPVVEALCVSTGRSWSYVTPLEEQEPAGAALLPAGSSVLAATSVYEGVPIPLPAAVLESRLLPWRTAAAQAQERVLDLVALDLLPQILSSRENVLKIRRGTIGLLDNVLTRFATVPVLPDPLEADLADDEALTHEEAARLVIGLQDREARDEAASFLAFPDAARRLWRALARRCVLSYKEHAAAPLSLVGWTAWALGDEGEARLALHLSLAVDPHYVFAALLDQAFDKGVEPDEIRQQLRGRTVPPVPRRSPAKPSSSRTTFGAEGTGPVPAGDRGPGAPLNAEGAPESGAGRETAEGKSGGGRRGAGSAARTGPAARTGSAGRPATRRRSGSRPGGAAPGRPGAKVVKRREGGGREAYTRTRRRLAASPPGCEGARSQEQEQREREIGKSGASDRRAAVDRSPRNGRGNTDPQPSDAFVWPWEVEGEADRAQPKDRIESPLTSGGPRPGFPGREAAAQDLAADERETVAPDAEQGGHETYAPDAERGSQETRRSASGRENQQDLTSGPEQEGQKNPRTGPGSGHLDAL